MKLILFGAVALALAASVSAQEGLYGSGAPGDAAFVRVVHATEGVGAVTTSIGEADFGPLEFAELSPYRPVAAGLFTVSLGSEQVELVSENGSYYTIAVTPSGAILFEDPEHTDPAESQIFLYNLLDEQSARLYAAERGTEVIPAVDAGASSQVAVTPVTVDLVVEVDGQEVANVGDPGFERGQSYSVFVFGRESAVDALLEQAQVATE